MSVFNQLFRMVSVWRDFNQNQLIETYQLKNHIDLHRLRLNHISKQNSYHSESRGFLGFWGYFTVIHLKAVALNVKTILSPRAEVQAA